MYFKNTLCTEKEGKQTTRSVLTSVLNEKFYSKLRSEYRKTENAYIQM